MSCLFCKIIAKEIPAHIVYEDADTLAFLDIFPFTWGHALVIPKTHATCLAQGSLESAEKIMKTVYVLAPRILSAVDTDGYNLIMNHGESAGQEMMHTHVHIIPRKTGVPKSHEKLHPAQEELARIAERIKNVS